MTSKTVLAVDDSAPVRQMVSLTLSTAGYKVIEAVDGEDGFQKAIANKIDAIVTDLNMPRLNGIEFIKKVRAHPSSMEVPIILLTTESDERLNKQAKDAGAVGCIVKPFKQDQLLNVIRSLAGA